MRRPGIDLHTHSTASDGRLSPAALVATAAEAGVTLLALTDHDTTAGVAEAADAAGKHGIRLLPAAEISVTWQRRTLHVVGLGVDPNAPALADGLAGLQARRRERTETIGAKLSRLGVADAAARARALAGDGQVTRSHFARLLVEDGRCRDVKQAFKRYLKPGKPGHARVAWAGLDEAIGWIHAAGGVAVLAHPLAYGMTGAWRRRMLTAFTGAGGDALEIGCGNSTPQGVTLAADDARRHGLHGSVGSDFHGPEQHWLKLGRPLPLPADVPAVWEHPRFRGELAL